MAAGQQARKPNAITMPEGVSWNAIKIFSATRARERESLGDTITDWIRANPGIEIFEKVVSQSSDSEFHCLSICLFFRDHQR